MISHGVFGVCFLFVSILSLGLLVRIGLISSILFAWVIIAGFLDSFGEKYSWLSGVDQSVLIANASLPAMFVSLSVGLIFFLNNRHYAKKILDSALNILAIVGFLNACLIIIQKLLGSQSHLCVGFMHNASLSASFSAMTWPLVRLRPERYRHNLLVYGLLSFLAVISAESSMALGVFLAALFLILNHGTAIFFAFALLTGVFTIDNLLHDQGRFEVWKRGMDFFFSHREYLWTGAGLGSWSLWFPKVQQSAQWFQGHYFTNAHNDFVQVTFELGLIGLGLYTSTILIAAFRLRKTFYFAPFAAWVLGSLGNSFLYSVPHNLLGLFLFLISSMGVLNDE